MKFSLKLGNRRPLDRSTAWACVMANQFAIPGLGSLAAGRRAGYAQIILATIGILPTLAFSLRLLIALYHLQQSIGGFGSIDELLVHLKTHLRQLPHAWGLYFWIGAPGVAFFATAWFWALISSIAIVSQAQRPGPRQRQS
jgi:hypothetical protein